MKWNIPHKKKGNIELEISKFTQITGTNRQLIFDVMQIIKWYFSEKKYTEEDLSLFSQNEISIENESGIVKQDGFKMLCFDKIESLMEQFSFKKGTISFDYLKNIMRKISFEESLESINNQLLSLVSKIDEDSSIYVEESSFHVTIKGIISENIIQKSLNPIFSWSDTEVTFQLLNNSEKLLLNIKMLEYILMNSEDEHLLILDGLDRYLSGFKYQNIIKLLYEMTKKYNLMVINVVFDSKYLLMEEEYIPSINIISDYTNHFYELEFMKERFINEYPINIEIEDEDMIKILKDVSQYIFTDNLEGKSISDFNLISIAIINKLYSLNLSPTISYRDCTEVEKKFNRQYYCNVKNHW